MGRLYVMLCVCLAVFGCMAGSFSTVRSGPRPAPAGANRDGVLEVAGSGTEHLAMRQADTGEIVLDRQDDGHFYADVEINGTPITMMVDTGASGVALSEADAHAAGIATSIGMSEQIGEGAGGAVYGDVVQIDRVRLGDMEARDLPGVVLKGGNMSLLGQNFLRRFGSVEIAGDQMVLR